MFEIPGQPPSVNHMYVIARGSRRLVKDSHVSTYQSMVSLIVRTSPGRPDWTRCSNQIRVRYWFTLARDVDCDNALKALNDAIALALGVNDRRFLPCVERKITGSKRPSVLVTMELIV